MHGPGETLGYDDENRLVRWLYNGNSTDVPGCDEDPGSVSYSRREFVYDGLGRLRQRLDSAFNLEALATTSRIAQTQGIDLWTARGKGGATIATSIEYLQPFLSDPKKWTKDQIAESWAVDRSESNPGSIEVYIHRLRRKLEDSGLAIRTVRGLGYLLELEA